MTELSELLPHKAPMILISGYEEPTADDSVTWKLEVEGTDYVLVYNGELYNVPDLRRELEDFGWTF